MYKPRSKLFWWCIPNTETCTQEYIQYSPIHEQAHSQSIMHTHQACDIKNSLSLKSPIPPRVPFEPGQSPHPQAPAERMGKLMTTIECLHFSWALKNTKNKVCDKLHYLVALPVRRQLLLERWKWGVWDREDRRMESVWVWVGGYVCGVSRGPRRWQVMRTVPPSLP